MSTVTDNRAGRSNATDKATSWVCLARAHGVVCALTADGGRAPLDGLMLPEGAYVADDPEELTADAPGDGYVALRVVARAQGGEVTEVVGTMGSNPPHPGPDEALVVAGDLGLTIIDDPVLDFQMAGGQHVRGHGGGVRHREPELAIKEWTVVKSWARIDPLALTVAQGGEHG